MSTTPATYELVMERGPEPGRTFGLTLPSHTIGRDPISDICISDPEVSRQHGLLIQAPSGGYRIQDLGSTNGTVIDGKRLAGDAYTLQPGQVITLGGSVALRYQQQGRDRDQLTAVGTVAEEESLRAGADDPGAEPERADQEALPVAADVPDAQPPEIYAAGERAADAPESAAPPHPQAAPAEQPARREQRQAASQAAAAGGASEQDGDSDPGRRILSIALGILLVLLCLCCSVTVFMYYVGGDWLLREMGVVP